MRNVPPLPVALLIAVVTIGCSGAADLPAAGASTPLGPAAPAPPPSPFTAGRLHGTVRHIHSEIGLPGATVRILDGSLAGWAVDADAEGRFEFTGLPETSFCAEASQPAYDSRRHRVTITRNSPSDLSSFSLLPVEKYTESGVGNARINLPQYVISLRIAAEYSGESALFTATSGVERIVMAQVVLGRNHATTRHDAVHDVSGPSVDIRSADGVRWSLTEVRDAWQKEEHRRCGV